jgi:hypothetical protein
MSSSLLFKTTKSITWKSRVLPVAVYEWNLVSHIKAGTQSTVFENSVLMTACWGQCLDLIRMKWHEARETCTVRNFIICDIHNIGISLDNLKNNEVGWTCSTPVIWFIWFRIGAGGGLLWTRQWTFGFHNMRGISWLAERISASQE